MATFFEGGLLFSASRMFQYAAIHFSKGSQQQREDHGLVFK